jgi:hypothetical protein
MERGWRRRKRHLYDLEMESAKCVPKSSNSGNSCQKRDSKEQPADLAALQENLKEICYVEDS